MAQNCEDENVAISVPPQQYESKIPAVKVPRSKQPGGYDCEFVEKPPSIIQTECSVCLLILREPQLISCCGHSFCGACIGRIKNDGKPCPLCNAEDFNLMRNKGLERSLNELDVKCSYFEQGCCLVGKLGLFSKHLEEDDSSTACNFVEVKCSQDCGDYYERRSIMQHEEFECPKRPFSCDYCCDFSSTFEDVVSNHYPVCGLYLLPCPNKCDLPYAIEREDLASHVDNDCPLTVVDCDFHYAGCAVRLPRKDMPDHLTETTTHLSLMAAKIIEKDTLIAFLVKEMMQRHYTLEAEVVRLRKEVEALKEDNAFTDAVICSVYDDSCALKEAVQAKENKQAQEHEELEAKVDRFSTMQARSERNIQSMTDRLQHNMKTFRAELTEGHMKLDEKYMSLVQVPLPP